ncbi:MAG: hypothetical protein U0572_08790 [Phycisphaerales bacterium]
MLIALGACHASAAAGVTLYQGESGWSQWSSVATGYTTVGFTDLGMYEPVAPDRYADLGVLITDPEGNLGEINPYAFPIDGHGIWGGCVTEFTLLTPSHAFASRFPGLMHAWLYSGATLVAAFSSAAFGGGGADQFAGFVSSELFDRVVFTGFGSLPPFPCDDVLFDDIYFSVVPAPSVLAVGAIAMLVGRGRRRS